MEIEQIPWPYAGTADAELLLLSTKLQGHGVVIKSKRTIQGRPTYYFFPREKVRRYTLGCDLFKKFKFHRMLGVDFIVC